MTDRHPFQEALRDALHHLYEPQRLRQNRLTSLFGLSGRLDAPAALRRILIEAIEDMEPHPDEETNSVAWQTYGPLMYRYVERLSQPEVADQLGLSVRHLRRKEHAAIEALAAKLWADFGLDAVPGPLPDDADQAAEPGGLSQDAASVRNELTWLRTTQRRGSLDLQPLLTGLATLSRGLATKHQVDFVLVQEKETIPQVTADQVAVRQAILSLLSVAIPRASGGRVELTCRSQRWEVLVGVHCAAYPDGPKPALADETESLRIAQELAELGGGRLELDVDARAFHASLALPALEQLPVVVIDDNVDTLRLLERYTAGTRYRLIPASDQQQAVELAKRTRPQVIVLDVMMPDVDGWEVLGQLRQDPATTSIPVVICTILAQKELAEHLGADAFIRKPVTRQPFLEALDSLLAREQGQPPERESN